MNLHNEKVQHNDSLELGDSWRDMPRKVEGVANKTNGLYRRSAVPDQAAVCIQFSFSNSLQSKTQLSFERFSVCSETFTD